MELLGTGEIKNERVNSTTDMKKRASNGRCTPSDSLESGEAAPERTERTQQSCDLDMTNHDATKRLMLHDDPVLDQFSKKRAKQLNDANRPSRGIPVKPVAASSQGIGIKQPRIVNRTMNHMDAGRSKVQVEDKLVKDYQIINKMDLE